MSGHDDACLYLSPLAGGSGSEFQIILDYVGSSRTAWKGRREEMCVCMHVRCVSVRMGKGRTGRAGGGKETKLKYFSARFFVYSLNFFNEAL